MLEWKYGDENVDRKILNMLGQPGNILDKLERYAAAAERSYSKALRDLQQLRLQTQKIAKQNKAIDAENWLRDELAKLPPPVIDLNDPTVVPRL